MISALRRWFGYRTMVVEHKCKCPQCGVRASEPILRLVAGVDARVCGGRMREPRWVQQVEALRLKLAESSSSSTVVISGSDGGATVPEFIRVREGEQSSQTE